MGTQNQRWALSFTPWVYGPEYSKSHSEHWWLGFESQPCMLGIFLCIFPKVTFHCRTRILLSQIWMHGIFGKSKYAVLNPEYFADLSWPKKEKKMRNCATSLLENIGWSFLQRRILIFTGSDLPRYPIFCWRANTAAHKQSRRFLKGIDNNFLKQVISEPTTGLALLHLMLTNKRELILHVKLGSSFGCSDHRMLEFSSPEGRNQYKWKNSQPWTSGEQPRTSSRNCLDNPMG